MLAINIGIRALCDDVCGFGGVDEYGLECEVDAPQWNRIGLEGAEDEVDAFKAKRAAMAEEKQSIQLGERAGDVLSRGCALNRNDSSAAAFEPRDIRRLDIL